MPRSAEIFSLADASLEVPELVLISLTPPLAFVHVGLPGTFELVVPKLVLPFSFIVFVLTIAICLSLLLLSESTPNAR